MLAAAQSPELGLRYRLRSDSAESLCPLCHAAGHMCHRILLRSRKVGRKMKCYTNVVRVSAGAEYYPSCPGLSVLPGAGARCRSEIR